MKKYLSSSKCSDKEHLMVPDLFRPGDC